MAPLASGWPAFTASRLRMFEESPFVFRNDLTLTPMYPQQIPNGEGKTAILKL